jgi:hypothetical protein
MPTGGNSRSDVELVSGPMANPCICHASSMRASVKSLTSGSLRRMPRAVIRPECFVWGLGSKRLS